MFLVAGSREDNLNGQEFCKNSQALRMVNSFAMMWLKEEVISGRPVTPKIIYVWCIGLNIVKSLFSTNDHELI